MISVGLWSQRLAPGGRVRVIPMSDFRLTSVTLSDELADPKGRSTIKMYRVIFPEDSEEEDDEDDEDDEEKALEFEEEPIILASLIPGAIETQVLDLVFTDDEPIEFEVTGKNAVYMVGNYIDQMPLPTGDGDSEEYDSDEEAYPLEDVSSDVEMDPAEMMTAALGEDSEDEDASRFEEVVEAAEEVVIPVAAEKPSKKRARESDAVEETPALSKSERKKLNKKLKAEGGQAVPAGEAAKPTDAAPKEKKDKKATAEDKKEDKKEKKDKTSTGKKSFTTKNGVEILEAVTGTGPAAKNGNTLEMRYIGKLQNGKVFDKNTAGKPFKFVLGKGEVIKGWDEGLLGMSVGSERVLTIPPQLAYGKKKMEDIPANSTLRFEVKLLSIK